MPKRLTPATHLQANPDLISEASLEILKPVPGGGLLRQTQRAKLNDLANAMRVPNERRHSGREVLIFLQYLNDIIRRALLIKEKGIAVGVMVQFDTERRQVRNIGRDYLVTLDNGQRIAPVCLEVIP